MYITFPDEESGHKGTRTISRTVQPPTFENRRDVLHILTFSIRARSVYTWNLKIRKEGRPLLTFSGERDNICLIPPTAIIARSNPVEKRMRRCEGRFQGYPRMSPSPPGNVKGVSKGGISVGRSGTCGPGWRHLPRCCCSRTGSRSCDRPLR